MPESNFDNFGNISIIQISIDNPTVRRLETAISVLIDNLIKYDILPSDKRLAEIKNLVYLELLIDSMSYQRNSAQLRNAARKVHRLDIVLDLLSNLHACSEEALHNLEMHYEKTV